MSSQDRKRWLTRVMYIALLLVLVSAARATAQDNTPAADPTPVPPTAATATAGATGVVFDTPVLNVRSGPGLQFPLLTTLALGQNVPLIGRDTAGGWLQMRLDHRRVGQRRGRHQCGCLGAEHTCSRGGNCAPGR
ncbi:MAG TPA: hypothetical protein PKE45_06305 [Caldilineaceae bacterium]|nr:hypothetical protein [Caldilineaceae bacterium]